jgi:membrane protein required for colicin V production
MYSDLHTLDLIVAAIVLLSGVLAFMHGLLREVLGIGVWIGASSSSVAFYSLAREPVGLYIPSPLVADAAAGALLFIGTFLILAIVSRAISRAFESGDGLGAINRSLGLMFGLARGAIILVVAYLALAWTIPERDHPEWITEAKTMPLIKEASAMLEQALPEEWRAQGQDAADNAKETADNKLLEGLIAPKAITKKKNDESGYNAKERNAMDQLIRDAK